MVFVKRLFFSVAILFCAITFLKDAVADELVPRTIIALYDDQNGGGVRGSLIHRIVEMPLNHLGLNVEYHEIHEPLPDIQHRADVRGVISWLMFDTRIKDPLAYLQWAESAVDSGKKYVVLGSVGVLEDGVVHPSRKQMNVFLGKLGINIMEGWVERPFDVKYSYLTPKMFLGPKTFNWTRPPYPIVKALDNQVKVHLSARKQNMPEYDSDLIVTGPNGGYIPANYIFRVNYPGGEEISQWQINPFEFFKDAFGTDDLPKPDETTIAGRRIYYSQIDGDGWNNVTQLDEYKDKNTLSAEVVMEKAVKPYPDLPVTLTIIAADIDPEWVGTKQSRAVAKEFFALPQVEAGTHTYSHPFYWQFFQEKNNIANEIPYLKYYGTPTWHPQGEAKAEKEAPHALPFGYRVPRAYATHPFDIHQEIAGSLKEIGELLPKGKKIEVLTWPGNCSPWEEVVRMTRELKIQNINGGDSRFDPQYPAFASLAPIGVQVGKERQIYASTSNENTYTNLWSENFHAHKYLEATLKNSESPVRLKPLNIYYHIYSGERQASLGALLGNLLYAEAHAGDIAPVTTSHYTRIAEGFYSTSITSLGSDRWRIDNRGDLQTIRFDSSALKSVDFHSSKGIVGQRHFQGSLYVYLDAAVAAPVIALKDNDGYYQPSEESEPYLIQSRWLISSLNRGENGLDFTASGFGPGEMLWQVASPGRYNISVDGKNQQIVASNGHLLKVKLNQIAMQPRHITITPVIQENIKTGNINAGGGHV